MKLWSNLNDSQELLSIIKNASENGLSIHKGCEMFCTKYPQYTIEQARSRYYQLNNSSGQINEQTIIKPWDSDEDNILLETFNQEIKNKKTNKEIFQIVSTKLNRTYGSVASRYYNLINIDNRQKKKNYSFDINAFKELLDIINIDELEILINQLNNIKNNRRDFDIIELHKKIECHKQEISYLKNKLKKKNQEIMNLKALINK